MNPLALRKSPSQLVLLLALGLPIAAMAATEQPVRAAPVNKFDAWRYGDQQVTWKSGPFVELCTRNKAACVMAKIPKSLGKIEAVVPGPFIQRARASWIAQSRFGSFLCAALSGKSVVACVRIEGDALPLRYVEVDVEITATINPASISRAKVQQWTAYAWATSRRPSANATCKRSIYCRAKQTTPALPVHR